jgi:hypothetical protein
LCNGLQTAVIEKDLASGTIRTATDFIVHTNHDTSSTPGIDEHSSPAVLGMETLLEESRKRQGSVQRKWERYEKRHGADDGAGMVAVREEVVRKWVRAYPVMNECTHFACLMDPKMGVIRWLVRGEEQG